jgi:hypothetical protein
MTNKLAVSAALALVAVAGLHRVANAAPGYLLSQPVPAYTTCGIEVQAQAGYWTDPGVFPKTGDVAYIKARADLGCVNSTAPGFDFFLPQQGGVYSVELAISAQNPVLCYRGTGSTYQSVPATDSTGACLQTPTTGPFGGLFFGWSKLDANGNHWLEIQVPVRYTRQSPGALQVKTSTFSVAGGISSAITLDVGYRTGFGNLSSIGLYGNLMIGFELDPFYEAGTLYIDYGTSTSLGQTNAATPVPAGTLAYPNVSTTIGGLTGGATYYWRPRFVTTWGTFVGPTQSTTIQTQGPGCGYRGRC